jgi:hypothetical protein
MSTNNTNDASIPTSVWWLAGFFAIYTLVMLFFLWKSASDPDDVAILNTVAAIISAPVGGLIAIAIFVSDGRPKKAGRDDAPVGNREGQQPATGLHGNAPIGIDSQVVGSRGIVQSVDEGVRDEQGGDELHSQSGDRHVQPRP